MTTPGPTIAREPRPPRGLPAALGGDERLARLVAHGHERAFAELYERYHQRIYRYVRAMVRHDSDAQDVLQAAFAKAFAALAEERRDAPLRPWLYRIAHNEAISTIRRRRPEVDLAAAGDPPAPSVEEVAGERARLAMLVADLQALTERQRGALVMRELSGLSHDEIDAALDLDPGAAKQTIFEARRSLAEFAQGRAMDCDDVCRAISEGSGRTLRGRRIRAHLRDCAGCEAFAAAITSRSRDLRAIAPPLPAAVAGGLLTHLLGHGVHGGSGGGGAGGATAVGAGGTAGKVAASGITTKLLAGAGVAVIAAGAGGVVAPLLHAGSERGGRSAATSKLRGRGAPAAPRGAAGSGRSAGPTARVPAATSGVAPVASRHRAKGHGASHAAVRGSSHASGHGASHASGHGASRARTGAAGAGAHSHGSAVSAARSHGRRGAQMKSTHRVGNPGAASGSSRPGAASHGPSPARKPGGTPASVRPTKTRGSPHTTATAPPGVPKVAPGQAKKSGR